MSYETLARLDPPVLRSTGDALEAQMELEARGIADAAGSADGREGIAAFLAKRRPDFKGE